MNRTTLTAREHPELGKWFWVWQEWDEDDVCVGHQAGPCVFDAEEEALAHGRAEAPGDPPGEVPL